MKREKQQVTQLKDCLNQGFDTVIVQLNKLKLSTAFSVISELMTVTFSLIKFLHLHEVQGDNDQDFESIQELNWIVRDAALLLLLLCFLNEPDVAELMLHHENQAQSS